MRWRDSVIDQWRKKEQSQCFCEWCWTLTAMTLMKTEWEKNPNNGRLMRKTDAAPWVCSSEFGAGGGRTPYCKSSRPAWGYKLRVLTPWLWQTTYQITPLAIVSGHGCVWNTSSFWPTHKYEIPHRHGFINLLKMLWRQTWVSTVLM